MVEMIPSKSQADRRMLAHPKWSDVRRKEGGDGLRTVDCLRGRLLAERAASKAAKDQVAQISRRVDELEKQLDMEIRSRDRAEKRLKRALKKLESLKLLDISCQVTFSGSSVGSSSEFNGDIQKSDGQKHDSDKEETGECGLRERGEKIPKILVSEDLPADDASVFSSLDSAFQTGSHEGSWSSVGTGQSHNNKHSSQRNISNQFQDSIDDASQHSGSTKELETAEHETKYDENSLALVPTNMWTSSEPKRPEDSKNVREVLVALARVREQLHYSVGQRTTVSSPKELYSRWSVFSSGHSNQVHPT